MNSTEHEQIISAVFVLLFFILVLVGIELFTSVGKDFKVTTREEKQ